MKFNLKLLFKASYFNAIIVAVKVLSGLVTSKVVAFYLGASGLALLGNLRSFRQTISSFTAEGYQNGTVRYISEYSESKDDKDRICATVFQLSLGFAFIIGVALWLFSSYWSVFLFKTKDYSYIIKILGIALPFSSFNLLIIYILNGLERFKKLVFINSVLNIVNMLVSVILILNYKLTGALIGFITGPILVFLINLYVLGDDKYLLINVFKFKLFSISVLKKLNLYLVMSIYSVVIVSVTFLAIRNLIIENLGVEKAGYWEAMNRISSHYLMFFLTLTSFYLLPRLSKVNSFKVLKNEIKSFYILSIPLLVVFFTLIYFLRFFLLKLLLSNEFLPTASLFFWQLVADFISVLAIVLVKQFHAKLMFKEYLFCNGMLNILYLGLSYVFIDKYGLVGVVKAYAISYFVYLFLVIGCVVNYYRSIN